MEFESCAFAFANWVIGRWWCGVFVVVVEVGRYNSVCCHDIKSIVVNACSEEQLMSVTSRVFSVWEISFG